MATTARAAFATAFLTALAAGCTVGPQSPADPPALGEGGGEESMSVDETGVGSTTTGDAPAGTTGGGEGSEDGDGDTGPGAKFDVAAGTGGSAGGNGCATGPDEDGDGDGWSVADGDCNDCDENVNPGAIEVETTEEGDTDGEDVPSDEDCNGVVDDVPQPCDGALAIDSDDPLDAARAIGLCKVAASESEWGVVEAKWVRADGAAIDPAFDFVEKPIYGILEGFGDNLPPHEGARQLVLSSGRARLPGQVGECEGLTCTGTGMGTPPPGFPQDVPNCAGSSNINDDVALELTLRAPSNATGYAFGFDFYSFEYPEWVCTSFNDQFIALVAPPPDGSIDGNISFDESDNPVSVNIAFFDVCEGCMKGTAELEGTGFDVWDDAGATGWLESTAPVEGGAQVTIRFAIWDTGDSAWDSTVLLDGFRWIADGGTVVVGTQPEG